MKKKIISCLLAMSLVASSGSYAFAARLDGNNNRGNTKLKKEVTSSYAVTIPEMIAIPNSNETSGTKIDIDLAEGGHLGQNEFVNVRIVADENSSLEQNAENGVAVKLENGESKIYSPLRLANTKDGGDIHEGTNLYKLKANDSVACFGATSETDGRLAKKGLSAAGYELYAYRGYTSTDLSNIADNELVAGSYEGTVTFELVKDDKEEDTTSQGLQTAGDNV